MNNIGRLKKSEHNVAVLILVLIAASILWPAQTLAVEEAGQVIHWGNKSMSLLGGLALFLFGMKWIRC